MVSAQYQAFNWKATVLITDEENVVDGWTHVEATIISDNLDWAKLAIRWIENNFAFGRETVIRCEDSETYHSYDAGQTDPIHKGYVRFSYRLKVGEWVRMENRSHLEQRLGLMGGKNV